MFAAETEHVDRSSLPMITELGIKITRLFNRKAQKLRKKSFHGLNI